MGVKIKTIKVDELHKVIEVLNHIPEFDAIFYKRIIAARIANTESIILVAEYAGKIIGCKIAYNRYFDGSIYSWLGGVLPPFRNQGVAGLLLIELERLAQQKFFNSIRFKTRNQHSGMLCFALKNGFQISGFELRQPIERSRIELVKMFDYDRK